MDFEQLGDGCETRTIHFSHSYVSVVEGLRDLSPDRLHFLAVGTPRGVELDEPLSLVAHLQETVAQF